MFRKALREAVVKEHLLEEHVDDVNLVIDIIKEGWRWKRNIRSKQMEFFWCEEQASCDQEEDKTKEEATFEKVRDLASSLVPGIVFTVDLPGRVPLLDI